MKSLKQIVSHILEKLKSNKIKKLSMYYDIDTTTVLTGGFDIDLRNPESGRKYLKIGQNCVIANNFIFEKQSGFVSVGNRSHIGGGSNLISINRIDIGDDVMIAWNCTIYDHDSHSIYWNERKHDVVDTYNDVCAGRNSVLSKRWDGVETAPIKICDKVWIGFGVTVLKGVTIGEGAVVGACSVVTHDVEPYTVVAGNPAKVIKKIEDRL